MTSVMALSELTRSCFSLWAFLLCLVGIFSVILAVIQKRYRFAVFSLPVFALNYFLWQVLFDIHLSVKAAVDVSLKLGNLPWVYLGLCLAALSFISLFILICVIRYGKRSVTPTAIKRCLDRMPCGVCLWRDDGRVLFSNICMNRLCVALTGSPLFDGNRLYDITANGILKIGEKRWRFNSRNIVLGGEQLHEMIASDISAEYAKTQALENDKSELSRLNRELNEYTLSIDDTVRRQEILQAKVSIHDEMNKLMLSTVAAQNDNAGALDRIFSLWEQNALLLCMEADKASDTKSVIRIEKLAKALKLNLIWQGDLPDCLSEKQRSLFFSAAQEAIVNAAKHAGAKRMDITFSDTETDVLCAFSNDGRLPSGEVSFSGGLYNLSVLAKNQGASVSVTGGENFTLVLRFPKNHPNG